MTELESMRRLQAIDNGTLEIVPLTEEEMANGHPLLNELSTAIRNAVEIPYRFRFHNPDTCKPEGEEYIVPLAYRMKGRKRSTLAEIETRGQKIASNLNDRIAERKAIADKDARLSVYSNEWKGMDSVDIDNAEVNIDFAVDEDRQYNAMRRFLNALGWNGE